MEKIITIFKSTGLRARATLLESLITIVFHLEEEFAPFVDRFIPVLIDQVNNSDWNVQKVGIDAINALTTTVADQIIPHRVTLLQSLKVTRVHKMKPVREASQWTIKLLKESHPPLEEHELAILDENPQKSQRASIRDQKSPIRSKDDPQMRGFLQSDKHQSAQHNSSAAGGAHSSKGNFSVLVQSEQRRPNARSKIYGESSEVEILLPKSR